MFAKKMSAVVCLCSPVMADIRNAFIISSIGLDDGGLRGSENHIVIGWHKERRWHCYIRTALLDRAVVAQDVELQSTRFSHFSVAPNQMLSPANSVGNSVYNSANSTRVSRHRTKSSNTTLWAVRSVTWCRKLLSYDTLSGDAMMTSYERVGPWWRSRRYTTISQYCYGGRIPSYNSHLTIQSTSVSCK